MKYDALSSESEYMKLLKFRTIIQNTDYHLAGRSSGVFVFGSMRSKFKAYAVPLFKRYNSDPLIATMETVFNPNKSSTLEVLSDQDLVQSFIELRNKGSDKNYSVYYRLIFWLLFSAAVNDDIYSTELSGIVDLAYCFDFDEKLLRDWCKAVKFIVDGGKLSDDSPLKFETDEGNSFFLHKN